MSTVSPSRESDSANAAGGTARLRFVFVMEQTLGHVTFAQNLRRAIGRDGDVDVEWIDVSAKRERRWEKLPVLGGNWSLRGSAKARRAVGRARRLSGRPDLYFFHTQTVALLSSGWLARGVPVVISTDATPMNYDRVGSAYGHQLSPPAVERAKLRLHRRAFRSATALVAWSEWTRRSLIDDYGVGGDRVHVVPPGTDLAFWEAANAARSAGDNDAVRVLFVGGDFERKGGRLLLDVFRDRFADRCELHLVTNGGPPDERNVVVHRGVRPNSEELRRLYERADVFVLPTEGDVFSIASVEAMAAGLPVITSRIGGIPEIVRDGETGFLIAPGQAPELAGALEKLTGDLELRRTMGRRARTAAEERFDGLLNARRLVDICAAAVRSSPPDSGAPR